MKRLGGVDENTLLGETEIQRAAVIHCAPAVVATRERADLEIGVRRRATFQNGMVGRVGNI